MRPLTLERPKPMILVGDEPLLAHIIKSLPEIVDEIILVIGYKGEYIREYFGDAFAGKKITYLEQKEKRGTADALFIARQKLRGRERFLLLYADDLHDAGSIKKSLEYPLSLLVYPVANPERFGIVVIDDNGRVINIEEKPKNPKSNLAAIGVYVLDQHIFDYQPDQHENGEYYLTTMIEKMIKDHEMFAITTAAWMPVGYPEDLERAQAFVKDRK